MRWVTVDTEAVGKELKASDLDEYMVFHNRKLFKAAYANGIRWDLERARHHGGAAGRPADEGGDRASG